MEVKRNNWFMRHKSLVAIWAIVFIIGGYTGYTLLFKTSGGEENPYTLSSSTSQQSQQSAPQESKQVVKTSLNKPATDNNLEFTVTGIKCGESSIGSNQYSFAEAEGKFCRLSMKIKNTSTQQLSVPKVARLAVDNGNEYKMDITATEYAQTDQTQGYWFEDIAAGQTVSGDMVFDLPATMTPTKAFLHGKEGSAGIEVSLK